MYLLVTSAAAAVIGKSAAMDESSESTGESAKLLTSPRSMESEKDTAGDEGGDDAASEASGSG